MTALEKGDAVFIGSSERLCFRFLLQGEKMVKKEKSAQREASLVPGEWESRTGLIRAVPMCSKRGSEEPTFRA